MERREMKFLTDAKNGSRPSLGFGLILLFLVLGAAGFWGVGSSSKTTTQALQGNARIPEQSELRRFEKDSLLNLEAGEEKPKYPEKGREPRKEVP